jgi:hypothetical protein
VTKDITHREIYDRLVAVETKVDALTDNTKDVVSAFAAAQGAFKVLETLGKLAKPLLWVSLWVGGIAAALTTFWEHFKLR